MSLWKNMIYSVWHRTPTLAIGAGLATSVCLAMTATAAAGTHGKTARVLLVKDTAGLHTANPNSTSSALVEEGRAIGTLPGTVRARLAVGVSVVSVRFTISLHGGSISGQATAKLNPGKGEYASFKGALSVTGGSGRYAHAVGSGQVYGTLNHYNYAARVQVIGQLRY
jgi:hypothetical protein